MSRIGKRPIVIPAGVEVSISGPKVEVKGPKGALDLMLPEPITAQVVDGQVLVERPNEDATSRELHGLSRTLVDNMIIGVTEGYVKRLEIVGTGYRAIAKGKGIEFTLGFSHPILIEPPAGIELQLENPTRLTVSGIDKQLVGETAANIRKLKKPEPYKGKGIRYAGEVVRRKAGKAGK